MTVAGRAAAVWMLIAVVESVHGTARRLFLEPTMGELPARQVSVFTGSILIFAVTVLTIRWIGARRRGSFWRIGGAWVVATVVFEVALGLATGASWARIWSDYDVTQGGMMPLGILAMAMAPWLAAHLRGVVTAADPS